MLNDPLIEVGNVFQERYRILEKLSDGGFGVVYKAEQLATGQTVAIKGIRRFGPTPEDDEKRLARFQREVRLCAQLHHPNIVRLIDSGWIDESMYAVFEYVPGQNLAELLAEEGRLSPVECGRLMGQVLDALSCAHDAGIIHRDLKPANIMVTPTGARRNATVLDFGIGGVLREAQGLDEKTLTRTFERMGTPAYSSPEQLRGRVLTPQTDIYSWGLVFLECLTGTRAIDGETIAEVMHRQLDETPVPIPRALKGHPLDELLRVATAKNPAHRRFSARELLSRLDACPLAALELPDQDVLAAHTPEGYSILGAAHGGAAHQAAHPSASQSSDPAIRISGSRPSTASTGEGPVADRERRQLTVVSCAVNVLAGGATTLDLEEQEEQLAEEVRLCRALAAPLGGHVMPAAENRVQIYFGYPAASGDDARRAVRAALILAREFEARSAETQRARGIRSSVHIGVHTGLALVREDAQFPGQVTFSGSAVRLASNIDAHAPANGVVISQATLDLVRAHFTAAPGARVSVTGHAEPLEVFQVAEGAWDEPLQTGDNSDMAAPLIGRDQDLDLLRRHWRLASEGRGQSVLIVGDPGIGKSRLVRELASVLRNPEASRSRRPDTQGGAGATGSPIWLQSRCMPENRNNALHPVIELLQRYLGFRPGSADGERRRKLEQFLGGFDVDRATAMPLLASLLGVPLGDEYGPLALAPQRQRELTLRTLLALLSDMALASPVVLVVEDVHWADASSLELLSLLLEEASTVSMLIVLTSRPEDAGTLAPTATLKLDRLDSDAAATLIQRCAGGQRSAGGAPGAGDRPLPAEVVDEILRRTDGVPLFVEEMVRAVLGSGLLVQQDGGYRLKAPLSALEIPASLRELLLARLDRLSREAKAALQIGAVLGREFGSEDLRAVGGYSDQVLRRLIDALVESGLLYCRRRLSGELFVFKHALVHDAAYESMPRRTRAMYHRHIARMIEERFPALAEKQPELLARHHASAGDILTALGYARRAALGALIASANEEAIGHAKQAIAWLQDLDPGRWDENQRAELELGFQAIIAPALLGTRGHGDREYGALARRSLRLISMVGDSPQVLPALWGLWIHHYMRSEYSRALPLAENYLERAERLGDLGARVIGHSLVGSTLFYLGRFAEAHEAAARSVELYNPEVHSHLMMIVGYDPKPPQLGVCALCSWMMGRLDEAAADIEDALAWSGTLQHAVTQGLAVFFQAHLLLCNGELALAERAAAELRALAERFGLDNWLLLAEMLLGTATRDIARTRAAMASLEQAHQLIGFSCWYAMLAESEAAAGRLAQAMAAIDEARDFAERTGEHHFLCEIHRRRGEILAAQPDPALRAQAEPSLRRAIEVARAQGAPLSELLSTASLCKLQAAEQRVDPATLDALRDMFKKLDERPGRPVDVPVLASARAVLADLGG